MTAGTVTTTEELLGNVKKITFAWVSGNGAEGGTASGATTYPYTGLVLRVVTVPDGTDAPDDNYDITLTDADGVDIANAQLANRDTANTETVLTSMGAVVGSAITLNVSGAGDDNAGTCYVYIGITPEQTDQVTDLENALYGASGITTYPAAAAAGNGVSIAEVVRYIQATQLGTITNTGGTATVGGILGDVANVTVASSLASILAEVTEVEGHFHTWERWYGKSADQSGNDWAADSLTVFRAISGNNTYGADANDEAKVFGTDDTVIAGQTKFDMASINVVAASATTVYKLRIVYGTGTMADAITAGQYTETMVTVASAASRLASQGIRMPRLTIGTDKVWCQAWNATDNATIDFYVGIHGYTA